MQNSFKDPIWDVSYDGKTVVENVTLSEIEGRVGGKIMHDTFSPFDLRIGVHKQLYVRKGRKSYRVRIQLHPMNKTLLSKQPDSFGTVK